MVAIKDAIIIRCYSLDGSIQVVIRAAKYPFNFSFLHQFPETKPHFFDIGLCWF